MRELRVDTSHFAEVHKLMSREKTLLYIQNVLKALIAHFSVARFLSKSANLNTVIRILLLTVSRAETYR